MKKSAIILLLVLAADSFCAQSRILNFIGDAYKKLGLPTFAEYAWAIDLINVYNQAAGFVRTTNQLVRSYKKCYREQMELKKKVEETWGNIQRLYSVIDPYDMDTWAVALDRAQYVIWYDCADILDAFNQKDYFQLGSDYVMAIDSIFSYDYRTRKNAAVVDRYYRNADYDSLEKAYLLAFDGYRNSTLVYLRAQLRSEQAILNDPNSSDSRKQASLQRTNDLTDKISRLEKEAYESSPHRVHLDTIIQLTSSLISYNLTELQVIESQIAEFERSADQFREHFADLRDGIVTPRPKDPVPGPSNERLDFSDPKIYGADANTVPPPSAPDLKPSPLKGKEVSAHDILHLQNAINFTSLRQEALLRDLSLIKAKTMTMVTVSEAYERRDHERQALESAFDAKLLSVASEKAVK